MPVPLPETDISLPEGPCRFRPGPPDRGFNGVSDGVRTRDPQDHNLVLYQLSYAHHCRLGTRD